MVKKLFIIFFIFLLVSAAILWLWEQKYAKKGEGPDTREINSFEDCLAFRYPVIEKHPRECRTPQGITFRENTLLEHANLIRITHPSLNEVVQSPLIVEGEARGYWFFEASFPVELIDESGMRIAQGIAQAQDEWMTESFVPFKVTLEFSTPTSNYGTLILHKDNPSGLPEYDDATEFMVRFTSP